MIEFYKPQIEDLWFREAMMADRETMSYNHAFGGTIPFPREVWKNWYDRWMVEHGDKRFYRYVRAEGIFVGEAAYRYDEERQIYLTDVIIHAPHRGKGYGRQALEMLCKAAKENGVDAIYDEIAIDNSSVALFLKCGFTEMLRTDEAVLVKKKFGNGGNTMRILHLTETDYKVGAWSGGSTTELFIWPEGADYAKREFTLRVSSARVDLEESDFTPLQGVTRYITPLTGGFTLTHPGSAPVVMGPLEVPYRFSGEIQTHCVGKATDFNLMLKGAEGEMRLCRESWQLRPGFNCLYSLADTEVALEAGYILKAGQLLVAFAEEAATVAVSEDAIVCFAEV